MDGKIYYGPEEFGGVATGDPIKTANGIIVPIDRIPIPVFSGE